MRIIRSELCLLWKRFLVKFSRAASISASCSGDPSLGSNSQTCRPTWPFSVLSHGLPPSAIFSFHIFRYYAQRNKQSAMQLRETKLRERKKEIDNGEFCVLLSSNWKQNVHVNEREKVKSVWFSRKWKKENARERERERKKQKALPIDLSLFSKTDRKKRKTEGLIYSNAKG